MLTLTKLSFVHVVFYNIYKRLHIFIHTHTRAHIYCCPTHCKTTPFGVWGLSHDTVINAEAWLANNTNQAKLSLRGCWAANGGAMWRWGAGSNTEVNNGTLSLVGHHSGPMAGEDSRDSCESKCRVFGLNAIASSAYCRHKGSVKCNKVMGDL